LKVIRDIVVIGAPIGGASALIELAHSLPADLPAAVLVVLHAHPDKPILLADALSSPGHMRAAEAIDGEPLERRRIYVASDGKHLRVDANTVRVSEDAGESRCCPSVDLLFASAAEHHKERVVGVILLHADEEGSAGLHSIHQNGGRTITHQNELLREPPRHPETGDSLADHHLKLGRIAGRVVAYVNGENGVSI
jgi:two-component system, chemotaxis family, protein-glutamate methylesterase/glutaminase